MATQNLTRFARLIQTEPWHLADIPLRYESVQISKRSGGVRTLSVPHPELKRVQRAILRHIVADLPVHSAATGFRRGKSIVDNARVHISQAVIIRMDITNYFGTTSEGRVGECMTGAGWHNDVAAWMSRLCCHNGGLPQGAPTSPALSNAVNVAMDARLDGLARAFRGRYTRYADDITISFDAYSQSVTAETKYWAGRIIGCYGYCLNTSKTSVIGRRHQQRVTGLVVNDGVALPRKLRRNLRAAQHRHAHGMPMHHINGVSGDDVLMTPEQMAGWVALCEMIKNQRKRR